MPTYTFVAAPNTAYEIKIIITPSPQSSEAVTAGQPMGLLLALTKAA